MRYKKKVISAAAAVCFIAVLAIGSDLSPRPCQFFMQICGADADEQMVSLWNINEGAVHQYIAFGEDIVIFNLMGEDVWNVEDFEIVLDGYERNMTIHCLVIQTDSERIDCTPQQILENFEIQGAQGWEIQEDGLLSIKTGAGPWHLKGSRQLCMELNRIRKK